MMPRRIRFLTKTKRQRQREGRRKQSVADRVERVERPEGKMWWREKS